MVLGIKKSIQGETRPDTRHKMRLVCLLFTFENNTGPTDEPTDGRTDGPTDRPTDTTLYREATAHLKRQCHRAVSNIFDYAMHTFVINLNRSSLYRWLSAHQLDISGREIPIVLVLRTQPGRKFDYRILCILRPPHSIAPGCTLSRFKRKKKILFYSKSFVILLNLLDCFISFETNS